ncbi:EamA family transporter [bacterium]|nr:EamA family transporter [bacterium]
MTPPLTVAAFLEAHMGEAFALTTAMMWAMGVIFFKKSGETVHPVALNLFKGTFAGVLLLPTMAVLGRPMFIDAPAWEYGVMLAGGAVGLGISDTFFFMALNRLGAARTAIIDCLYSPSMILFAAILLGERLNAWQLVGVAMIISAVLVGNKDKEGKDITTRDVLLGMLWGTLAMTTMAISIVGIKPVLERWPLLWSMEMRLVGGNIMLLLMLPFYRNWRSQLVSLVTPSNWRYMAPAAFFGTYLALVLWLGGMKYTEASIAGALNQTANLFIFLFAWIFLRETITWNRALGILIGVAGVILVTTVRGG